MYNKQHLSKYVNSMNFDKCIYVWNHPHNQDTEHFHHFLCAPLQSILRSALALGNHWSFDTVSSFHFTQVYLYSVCSFMSGFFDLEYWQKYLCYVNLWSIPFYCWVVSPDGHFTLCLSIYLAEDIWIVSLFWLWVKLLEHSVQVFVWT